LPLLLGINDVHLMSWIEEPQFCPECLGNFARVWCDLWGLRRNGNKHLHEKVARWYVGGIEGAHKANVVFWIGSVKAELFMKFTDRSFLRRFVPLEFATRKGDLSTVSAALSPLDQ
jgi:hypothetical protein